MSETLLRCPFCGGEAELLKGQCEIDNYVMCLECRSKTKLYNTKASAIKAWNTRKPMQNIVERLEEQAEEENFIRMMKGQMLARGLKVKDGYTPEEIVRKTLTTVKNRLKWKRPVSTKEKETYTLVERNLFSKQNISKYFIQNT